MSVIFLICTLAFAAVLGVKVDEKAKLDELDVNVDFPVVPQSNATIVKVWQSAYTRKESCGEYCDVVVWSARLLG